MSEELEAQALPSANILPQAVDDEISRLHQSLRQTEQTARTVEHTPSRNRANDLVLGLLRELRTEMYSMNEQMTRLEISNQTTGPREHENYDANQIYGRTKGDVRNRRSMPANYISLKEARAMIPEFNGNSQHRLRDFLYSCTYAMEDINPADEELLMRAILYTKLRGKARQDFETRNI